jgi:signal peptidase II
MKARLTVGLVLIAIVYLADRLIKQFVIINPEFNRGFFDGILSFHYVTNAGIAFGVLLNGSLILVAVVVLMLLLGYWVYHFWRQNNVVMVWALLAIIAGALSNFIDRLRYGFVVDYIDVSFWTVFNLADTMITVGVGLILWQIIFNKKEHA